MKWLRALYCAMFGHDTIRVMVRTSVMKEETIGYEICRRCQHAKVIK